ncbi:MAG TPA: FliA/WhiG family RNA polymerase sigma factor [Acidimicrobiales bacterium]|nr:FliA/WhiG family RNA polymerase sigma factor [Acidimicrobiales bacterium]
MSPTDGKASSLRASRAERQSIASLASGDKTEITDLASLEHLWRKFWARHECEDRNALVVVYQNIVHTVATRLPANVRANWSLDDLESSGLLGLIEAIGRFDETSQISLFPAYAQQRIRGAIYDELRRLDWLPRTIRRRVITYRVAVDDLSSELGRTPNRAEVMNSMGIDPREENELVQQVQSAQLTHFRKPKDEDDWSAAYRSIDQLVSDFAEQPESKLLEAERIGLLRAAIAKLPERQRTVVTLHFFGGLTQDQIGAILGVGNSRVSQIETSAIKTLRHLLRDEFDASLSASIG